MNKTIQRKSKILFLVSLFSIGFYSCSTNENINEQIVKSYDIEEIRVANKEEVKLTLDFINKHNLNIDVNNPEVVNYTELPGKSIVLNYTNKIERSNSVKSLILVVSEENEIITYYGHEKIDNGKFYTVNTYKEDKKWFVADVDKESEEIIKINFVADNTGKDVTFWECAEIAVSACVNDGSCAFICGITWQYCLGSIGLACAYVSIVN